MGAIPPIADTRQSPLIWINPKKDEIIETANAGKMIKARIDAYREERQAGGGSRSPFFEVTAIKI
jgi:hypothetical protein